MKLYKIYILAILWSCASLAGSPPFILPPQGGNAGKVLGTNGATPSWVVNGAGSVTSVTASSPLFSSGGTTPNLTIQAADATHNGYLTLGDWNLFNGKQDVLTFSPPLVNTSGTISIPAATSLADGYLTSSDWTLFNGKQSALTFGSISTSTTGVTVGSGSNSTVGPNVTVNVQTASGSQPGLLSAADWTTFNGKQAAGNYITALTGDVSASGPGSAAATVNSVGGSTAANVNSATVAANAATSSNTINTIVKRDGSGNFSAGTVTAALTGTASGNTTYTANNHGIVVSGSGNAMTVVAPDASTTKLLTSGGSSTDPSWQTPSTTNITEGSNLYYTDARVQALALAKITAQNLWVDKSRGNDSNDGSLLKPYLTIQAAINAANSLAAYYKQVDIHISPINNGGTGGGNYNENLTLSQQGVNLICDHVGAYSRPCVIGGTLSVNLTGTSGGSNFIAASNEVTIQGLVFTSGNSDTVTFSGTTFQRLIAMNCYFQASAARAAVLTNTGTSSGTPSQFRSYDTVFENNSSSIETARLTAGRFWFYGTTGTVMNDNAAGKSVIQDGASSMIANLVQFTGQYQQTDNTSTATFNLSTVASGTASCFDTPSTPSTGYTLLGYAGCNSSNANAVTGSGVVVLATGNGCIGTACSFASTVTTSSLAKLQENGIFLPASTGALTAVSTNQIVGYGKTVRALKIENMVGAAATFTCSVNPTITLYDCGTSAGACTSGRTALASVTLTAANTGTNGSVTSSTLAAAHYWAMEISAGTCTVLDATASAEAANQ